MGGLEIPGKENGGSFCKGGDFPSRQRETRRGGVGRKERGVRAKTLGDVKAVIPQKTKEGL